MTTTSAPTRGRDQERIIDDTDPGPALRYPPGSLVLLAGLPGAGKSTLLNRLYGLSGEETAPVPVGDVRIIDSRQSRNWWARFLRPLPVRLRTPLVHVTHVWRIGRAVLAGHGVVAHTRGTWPHILHCFAWLARRRGGRLHLILIDVDPATARAGQFARGRAVTGVTFARHCRRWVPLMERARGGALPPAAGVTVLDREAADKLTTIRFD
ncbi:ATP-binding protein [Actinomadura sp. OS1-43]|uniref:ATP-binding protein n=1 Tax=Actinomadura sp. OS1-43 TaxID=604315 RepID=UPI00255B09B9|nr:ATP-binding protein [Actinomadura sp. OS1-43]MDL4820309.1 ATP-binding protein [Actinomadura sp. OS1-43]